VNRTVRPAARGLAALGAAVLLVGPFGPAGCDDPAKGTAQVPAETHARLQPRQMFKGKLGQAAPGTAADGKPVSDAKPVNK
jgi:hypothetical protein